MKINDTIKHLEWARGTIDNTIEELQSGEHGDDWILAVEATHRIACGFLNIAWNARNIDNLDRLSMAQRAKMMAYPEDIKPNPNLSDSG